jgi:transcriptional regulator with XRE-family HTH domain
MPMVIHIYRERDYAFGQAIVTLRTAMGLTQVELARFLGISRGAVLGWEAGSSYPKAESLKRLIALGVHQRAFAAEREEEKIRALWQAAHQKVLLDELWLSSLLGQRPPQRTSLAPRPGEGTSANALPGARPAPSRRVDWDDALAALNFYGRKTELATLEQWVVQERCRVVSVLGMGGIGKSALVVALMHQVAEHFEVVLFRPLRDAPSCEVLLADCLQLLSPQLLTSAPASLQGRLNLLLESLRERR